MKRLLVLFLVGLMASPAIGQIVIQPNIFQNPLGLVEIQDVQKDLKLSDEQTKKLIELSREYAAGIRGLGFQQADLEKRKKAHETASKGLVSLLDLNQAKRLKQLELQQRGAGVFADPQIVKELELTPAQRGIALTALQGFQPKWLAIIQGAKGNQQKIQKEMADVHRDISSDIVNKLTKDQQAKWHDIAGPPFAGTFPSMLPVFVDTRPQPTLTWHLNDLNGAVAEAKKTGKPIFATFRCEA